ncbi:MAG TPA: DNA repair exonuclease [Pirellulales bacterium]|nr:DNA repair exonuclease [Pirellulales bacterium]
MSQGRLRFIHTSDWHLERPLGGIWNLPDRLQAALLDAPYLAAERVVDAVLAEQADFLVLAGDILDVELAGPHGVDFLLRQFGRLRERQIPVYWAGGRVDRPERWPAALALPDNVFRFSQRRPEDFIYGGVDGPRARLTGISRSRGGKIRAADFWPDADGLPTIAVACGKADRASLASRDVGYWALGGKHRCTTLCDFPQAAHYSGSPQARSPDETGTFGCTCVEFSEEGKVHTRQISTDVVRWQTRRVAVVDATTAEALESSMIEQLNELRRATPGLHLLVSWAVHGHGPLIAALRRGRQTDDLLNRLRRRFEQEYPAVWVTAIEVEPESAVPPAWLEHDSFLGDYLRTLAQFDGQDGHEPTDLLDPLRELIAAAEDGLPRPSREEKDGLGRPSTLSTAQLPTRLDRLVELSDDGRRKLLQKAAALGVDLLTSEETRR